MQPIRDILLYGLPLCLTMAFLMSCEKDDPVNPPSTIDSRIYAKTENPLGKPVKDWIVDFEKFSLTQTCAEVTELGVFTIPGGNDQMAFLSGTILAAGTADITIQADQSLFVPIAAIHYPVPSCPNFDFQIQQGENVETFLSSTVMTIMNGVNVDLVKLDQKAIANIESFRYRTSKFSVTPNPDLQHCGLLCYPPGELETMMEGFFIVIKPLPVGSHRLDLSARDEVFGVNFISSFNINVL